MRILEAIYSDYIGGSEMLGLQLAVEFSNRGHTCDVLATYVGDEGLRPLLDESGLTWFSTAFTGKSIAKRIMTPIRLFKIFKKQNYDVIHAHHMSVFITCYWPARLAGVKRIVVTEHAHQQFIGNEKRQRRSRRFGPKADRVTVIHDELRRFFNQQLKIPAQLIQLIPNGVDTDKFTPGKTSADIRRQIEGRKWDVVLGCVSRMHPDKDIPNLIRSFNLITKSSNAKVGLIVVGDGEERPIVERLVQEYQLGDKVWLAGSQTDVSNWLRAFDVFVLPSRREGVPLAILEALSCGIPVVATAVGGMPEIIDDAVGRLAPPENPQALASAALQLVDNSELRVQAAQNARSAAEQKYSFQLMVDRYLRSLAGEDL